MTEHAGPRATDVRLLEPQVLDVETVQRAIKRVGKDGRRWRLLYEAVEREVESLRRSRRLAQRSQAERAALRREQFAAIGVGSVDELVALYLQVRAALERGEG